MHALGLYVTWNGTGIVYTVCLVLLFFVAFLVKFIEVRLRVCRLVHCLIQQPELLLVSQSLLLAVVI